MTITDPAPITRRAEGQTGGVSQPNPLGVDRLGDSGGFRRRDRCSGPSLILITGEGSHQMTAQEISQFGRHGLHPIVLVLNNSGYLSERLLCKDMALAYNDIAV
jgi:TPP-dependent 2-oxoacid decarboxylase